MRLFRFLTSALLGLLSLNAVSAPRAVPTVASPPVLARKEEAQLTAERSKSTTREERALVSAHELGRQYAGDPIFTGLRFEVRAGERIGLVGTNGAGKTTLLRLLAGGDQPDYGHLHVRPGIRVSLLRQEPDFGPEETLLSVARSGLAMAARAGAQPTIARS